MPKVYNRALKILGETVRIGSVSVQVKEFDASNNILRATGATVPTDGLAGFAVGAQFTQTDGAVATAVYVNEGSATSCDFNPLPSLAGITLTPDDSEGAGVNVIPAGVSLVTVGSNVNGVNDFIVLPSLADVPDGFCITIVSNAAGHEVRTPASSNEEINSEDCDGTKEYAIASGGQIHRFTKISNTIGWMGQGFTAIGAVVTAVIPD